MNSPVLLLVVFFVIAFGNVLFGAGIYFRNKTSNQFTSGRGKIAASVAGLSIFTILVSIFSFLILPGKTPYFISLIIGGILIVSWLNPILFNLKDDNLVPTRNQFHNTANMQIATVAILHFGFTATKFFTPNYKMAIN